MYEEEDDDLPMGYRRLTAHLQTGSADFNRRLAAYLTNHVAMRSALDQAIHPYGYPNPAQIAPGQPSMFPSPLMAQGIAYSPQQQTPTSPRTPHPYRQTPYPVPGTPGFRPSHQPVHNRSASMSLPQSMPNGSQSYTNNPVEQPSPTNPRRMSMPASSAVDNGNAAKVSSPFNKPTLSRQASSSSQTGQSAPGEERGTFAATTMGPPSQPYFDPGQHYGISPLSMTLPQDSQMLLGPALNANDPFTSMLMGGNPLHTPSYYSYNPFGANVKQEPHNPAFHGMDSTLAPSALSASPKQERQASASADFNEALPQNFADIKGFEFSGSQNSSIGESATAQDANWDTFIDDKSWTENAT